MNTQAIAWKAAATAAYDALENARTTEITGWETAKTAAEVAHTTANENYETAKGLYDAEIIKTAVTEAASAAASGITAVTDARGTAETARDTLNTALDLIADKIGEIDAEKATLATKTAEWKVLVGDCEVA